jgi:hypothetical protein
MTALRRMYRGPSRARRPPLPERVRPPLAVTSTWDASKGDAIVGDWTKLAIRIREDVSIMEPLMVDRAQLLRCLVCLIDWL